MEKATERVEIITVVLESLRVGLVCQTAVKSDIPRMVEIEKLNFGDREICYKEEDFEKWFEHNPDMLYVVKKQATGEILAFTILVPISKKLKASLEAGEVSDLLDFPLSEVYTQMQSDDFYLADICNDKKYGFRSSGFLTAGAILLIHDLSRVAEEPNVEKCVYSSPITEDGLRTNEGNGFFPIGKDSKGNPIWKLVVTEQEFQRKWSIFKPFELVPTPNIFEQLQSNDRHL